MRATWLFLPIAMGLGFAPAARTEQRFDLPTRQGATQPIYLTEAANPIASAVLYPGGTGLVSHEIGQQMHAVLSPPLPADPGHHTRGVA